MSCYTTSDNKYFNCPARMSDGRHFTDYRPHCQIEQIAQATSGAQNSFQYRMWLQQNGDRIMDANRNYNQMKNGCDECGGSAGPRVSTMLPAKYTLTCTEKGCSMALTNPAGLGVDRSNTGIGVCGATDFPKKPANCCTPATSAFGHYGIDGVGQFGRVAMPSGGTVA